MAESREDDAGVKVSTVEEVVPGPELSRTSTSVPSRTMATMISPRAR